MIRWPAVTMLIAFIAGRFYTLIWQPQEVAGRIVDVILITFMVFAIWSLMR